MEYVAFISIDKISSYYIDNQQAKKLKFILVARSHRIAVMEDRVQALLFVVELSCAGSISHFGSRKCPRESINIPLLLLSSINAQSL